MGNDVSIGAMFAIPETETFFGLPSATDPGSMPAGAVALIGVPAATPYATVGAYCAAAPGVIRRAMDGYALTNMDFDRGGAPFPETGRPAVDCGDLVWSQSDHAGNRQTIRGAVSNVLNANGIPVLLGGDDSIPIPMLEVFADHGPITVLQIDAHIDWREEVNGERLGLSSTMRRASEMGHVNRIIQVGQRGIGSARPGDYQDALDWGVQFVSARDLQTAGIAQALAAIEPGAKIVVAFDYDALDPAILPGAIGRAPGGLTYWQAVDLIEGAANRGRIVGMGFVEFVPDRDVDGIGALTAARLLATAMSIAAGQGTAG
ncbi:MAG: arginase family protein [Pseudomonadota bacterium]